MRCWDKQCKKNFGFGEGIQTLSKQTLCSCFPLSFPFTGPNHPKCERTGGQGAECQAKGSGWNSDHLHPDGWLYNDVLH